MQVRGLLDITKTEEKIHHFSALQTTLAPKLLLDAVCTPYLDLHIVLWDGPQLHQKSCLSPRQLCFLDEVEHMIHRVKL